MIFHSKVPTEIPLESVQEIIRGNSQKISSEQPQHLENSPEWFQDFPKEFFKY